MRLVPVPGRAKRLVDNWAHEVGLVFRRFRKGGWLVYHTDDDGKVRPAGISADGIANVVSTYARPLGRDLTPSGLRRTFAKLAKSGQAPREQIQLVFGHQTASESELASAGAPRGELARWPW